MSPSRALDSLDPAVVVRAAPLQPLRLALLQVDLLSTVVAMVGSHSQVVQVEQEPSHARVVEAVVLEVALAPALQVKTAVKVEPQGLGLEAMPSTVMVGSVGVARSAQASL